MTSLGASQDAPQRRVGVLKDADQVECGGSDAWISHTTARSVAASEARPERRVLGPGILDPLVQTGRGSYVFFRSTTLEKLLISYDRAYPDFTDCSREDVIQGWRGAERWIRDSDALAEAWRREEEAARSSSSEDALELESLAVLIRLHRENFAAWMAVSDFADTVHPGYDPSREQEVEALSNRDLELIDRIIHHPADSPEVVAVKGAFLAERQARGALNYEEAQEFVRTFLAGEQVVPQANPSQDLIGAYHAAEQALRAEQRKNPDQEYPDLWDAKEAAEMAVLRHPCETLDDVRRKVRLILADENVYDSVKNCGIGETDVLITFLRSLLGEGVSAA